MLSSCMCLYGICTYTESNIMRILCKGVDSGRPKTCLQISNAMSVFDHDLYMVHCCWVFELCLLRSGRKSSICCSDGQWLIHMATYHLDSWKWDFGLIRDSVFACLPTYYQHDMQLPSGNLTLLLKMAHVKLIYLLQ